MAGAYSLLLSAATHGGLGAGAYSLLLSARPHWHTLSWARHLHPPMHWPADTPKGLKYEGLWDPKVQECPLCNMEKGWAQDQVRVGGGRLQPPTFGRHRWWPGGGRLQPPTLEGPKTSLSWAPPRAFQCASCPGGLHIFGMENPLKFTT